MACESPRSSSVNGCRSGRGDRIRKNGNRNSRLSRAEEALLEDSRESAPRGAELVTSPEHRARLRWRAGAGRPDETLSSVAHLWLLLPTSTHTLLDGCAASKKSRSSRHFDKKVGDPVRRRPMPTPKSTHRDRHRQPEGRCWQNHDRGESGGEPGGGRATDAAHRYGSRRPTPRAASASRPERQRAPFTTR